ncbi:hypothetical protein [Parapedobacter tibetensis]|uniref:hypothetical protein n=1 Tax=Parapedobacter tibetensis TaxID=2972951 RepID=UPI00214DBB70|nr:hypothetical protein [Parapedobacter tibetensis]
MKSYSFYELRGNHLNLPVSVVGTPAITYTYEYYLRDHQGNSRIGFNQGTNVTIPNFTADYYPFGLQHQQYKRPGNPKPSRLLLG